MDERIQLDLTDREREILRSGLHEWGGPAWVTQELAVAMGFRDQSDLFRDGDRLVAALKASKPMTPLDWAKTILATEIVFASDLVGSGCEWSTTTGWSDDETLTSLREIQRKVPPSVYAVFGRELGTRPPGRPLE